MPEGRDCAMAEEALMELSVSSLAEAPESLRAHLATCARCTARMERIRQAERAMHDGLGAVRSGRYPDELAREVLAISRSQRGPWRVPGTLRIAGIAAGTSTISAMAAGLVLYLLLPRMEQAAAVAPQPHQATLILASSSVVLLQDDRVVVVLASRR
ncbi:MAG TPA: hypothetical protein VFN83_06140 [Gemmatimonadales bacterium]|nr:hypothetical protein [Gemmatimonadales bacterium]